MTKTKRLLRLVTLLLLMIVGMDKAWALYTNVGFTNQNRISNNGAGVFTSNISGSNQYALAIADLSGLNGINTVGVVSITFDVNITLGGRWQIGIGDKRVRGTNANGSSGSSYNTTGLMMQISDDGGIYYRVKINGANQYYNSSSAFNGASGRTVRVYLLFNRISQTFNYSLTDVENSTVYIQGSNISTTVESVSIIEAYTWTNNSQITLSNVTVNYNFFFDKTDETVFIEDLVYNNPLNNAENKTNVAVAVSDNSYLREDHANNNYYPIKPTGTANTELTEGAPITVTATADGTESTSFKLRIKTRNDLDINSMKLGDVFTVGTTLGLLPENSTVTVNGVRLTLSNGELHSTVVRSINGGYGLTIIDKNGYTHGNYDQSKDWGTVYKFENTTGNAKTIYVTGYFDTNSGNAQLYDATHTAVSGQVINNPGDGTLASGSLTLNANSTYYLYLQWHVFALNTFSGPRFEKGYDVTAINSTYRQAVSYMSSPTYSVVSKAGDLSSASVSVSGDGTVSGLTAGGAVKIQATNGVETVSYVLTVAYEATPYPGKLWDFNSNDADHMPDLNIYENTGSGNVKGFPWLDGNSDATITVENSHANTLVDSNGDEWVARLKNTIAGHARDPRWRRVNAVNGDNAFIVPETAGLVFNTGGDCFFVRADRSSHWCWSHVGIRRIGSSFTIPLLKAGDVVEINWKRESSGGGGTFSATNATDLRGKEVTTTFEMTGSQNGTTGGVLDIKKNPGYTSFVATANGNVTFTLQDGGAADILSIRIYSGGYRSTMRTITGADHRTARTSMLLDNSYQEYEYNYCNVLNSTNTGPAWYVLKGYVDGTDATECMTGTDAGRNFQDGQPYYYQHYDPDGYPVTTAESARLLDLRKNLVGFRMYNANWQSSRNGYNRGRVGATSGYGKVTIRMNNYTNDLQYVIGYTNDITMTIGSAPHQTYPYTWDFTKIAGGTATGESDNVLYSIEEEGSQSAFSGQTSTNWIKNENGQFMLNTDNSGEIGSQYVPGAVLVSTERALSKYPVPTGQSAVYAKDELDGLGFEGDFTMHIDHLPSNVSSGWNRVTAAGRRNSLLSFKTTDYATFVPDEGTELDEHIGNWTFPTTEQTAGNGIIQMSSNCRVDESTIPSGGLGYRLDGGNTKYIHFRLPTTTLQVGDIISVTAFNAYNYRNAGVSFYKTTTNGDTTHDAEALAQSRLLSGRLVEETINYTVTANDGLDGRNDFYLYQFKGYGTTHITSVEITRSASAIPSLDWSIYTLSNTTITIPDLNADDKQDWIYVSASIQPTTVTNATLVTSGSDGPDANQLPMVEDANTHVYKYKVTAAGNVNMTFATGTKIYKIGVTHILKEIHPVGGTGWATEIRNHSIDHELTGYFTKNDVNAYTVSFDSYDLTTATVALTPINEDGYVPQKTGMVLRLDNIGELEDANNGKNVPLFYPSYTKAVTSTAVDFPDNNLMYNVDAGIDNNNRNYNEVFYNPVGNGINYTKFVLTNVHWKYTVTDDNGVWVAQDNASAAGFYRLHIWGDDRDIMAANTAFLCVPTDQLPVALWSSYPSSSSPQYTIGIRETDDTTGIVQGASAAPAPSDGWYTLSGMKLADKPKKAGLYIHNGRKILLSPYDF